MRERQQASQKSALARLDKLELMVLQYTARHPEHIVHTVKHAGDSIMLLCFFRRESEAGCKWESEWC